jgi:predicted TIM-barrel fold metal-dependent hydrolase
MSHVIDMEMNVPNFLRSPHSVEIDHGRPGTPFSESLPRPAGYGFENYEHVFRGSDRAAKPDEDDGGMERLIADMDRAGIAVGYLVGARNSDLGRIKRQRPDRFICFATLNPMDGMRAVRELERLVKEDGVDGLRVNALYNCVSADDRRYYPLYAKCAELGVPVRIYTSMNYANDRPYDLGHPKHLDNVAIDFPELRIIAGLGGWPWVNDMIGLLRRHPNLYCDTAAHRPRYLAQKGSGWEQFLQFGNTLLQDKIMVGLSRYLFATSFEELIAEYRSLPLKGTVVEKWLYGNAARFFRLG